MPLEIRNGPGSRLIIQGLDMEGQPVGAAGRWVWVDGRWLDAGEDWEPLPPAVPPAEQTPGHSPWPPTVTEVTGAHAPETPESHDE